MVSVVRSWHEVVAAHNRDGFTDNHDDHDDHNDFAYDHHDGYRLPPRLLSSSSHLRRRRSCVWGSGSRDQPGGKSGCSGNRWVSPRPLQTWASLPRTPPPRPVRRSWLTQAAAQYGSSRWVSSYLQAAKLPEGCSTAAAKRGTRRRDDRRPASGERPVWCSPSRAQSGVLSRRPDKRAFAPARRRPSR